jgi:RNA polymerase sigma factor (sigma-70 family)
MDEFEQRFPGLFRTAFAVAHAILGDRTEAADVAQECMARALVRWRDVRTHPEPWVVRVAGNLAVDVIRRQRRIVPPDEEVSGPDVGHAAADCIDLQRALLGLPRRQRDVLLLRYFADLTERDVAGLLGCSVGSVKTHAHRGIAALRLALSPKEK